MALMKFVQDYRVHAMQFGVGEQAARQYAFREEMQAGALSGDALESNLIPNRLSQLLRQFPRHAPRGEARRDPARLKNQHLAADGFQQRGRNASGFAGAGLSLDDEVGTV